MQEEESQEAPELLKRPKEYTVKFTFPNPPPLSPPILGLHSKNICILCMFLRPNMRHKDTEKRNKCLTRLLTSLFYFTFLTSFWETCANQLKVTSNLEKFPSLFFSYSGVDFGYEGQKPLFKNVDFGIDMESRSKYAAFTKIHLSCRTMTNALQSNNSCTCICLLYWVVSVLVEI